MRVFVLDAFTSRKFSGNQAGVVLLDKEEDFPCEDWMKALASELKHSETAYVRREEDKLFHIRYFTPTEEVELCGHATIASFATLREEGLISTGNYKVRTLAGELVIEVEEDAIWMDMAQPVLLKEFSRQESIELYQAFGLDEKEIPSMLPKIISTGLADIIMPVASKEALHLFVMNRQKVIELSKRYDVTGMHLFVFEGSDEVTAYCRNVAPLVGIDEECATGTANGALTHYLQSGGLIQKSNCNTFIQGQSMGRASKIQSRYRGSTIVIGGDAVVLMECVLR